MQMSNYWKEFENTGKIEDYLSYKACASRRSEGVAGCKSDYRERETDAGIYKCDGNDLETVSHGRI